MTKKNALVILLIGIVGAIPIILYLLLFYSDKSRDAEWCLSLLKDTKKVVLIDVHQPHAYEKEHISGAINIEKDIILNKYDGIDAAIKAKTWILICEGGISTNYIANKLKNTKTDIYTAEGGLQRWKALQFTDTDSLFCHLIVNDKPLTFPYKNTSSVEQLMLVLSAFVVKPLYMILSFLLFFLLKRTSLTIRALRYSMLAFFLGEAFCAINYLFTNEESLVLEYLHSFGMLVSFGFVIFAALHYVSQNIIRFENKQQNCLFIKDCKQCYKYKSVSCKLQNSMLFVTIIFFILAFIPLLVPILPISYNTNIYDTFYNSTHFNIFQLFEKRYLSHVSILLFFISFLSVKFFSDFFYAKIFFSAAMGMLSFSFFRIVLLSLFAENMIWFAVLEEITELMFIITLLYHYKPFLR